MRINNESLDLLRYHLFADSSIGDEQRRRELNTISYVENGLATGELVAVDRLDLIRDAVSNVQSKKNVKLRKKLKDKSRRVMRNATEDTRSIKSLDAFDEKVMYSSDDEVRRYADNMGITDAYNETKRFDDEWN